MCENETAVPAHTDAEGLLTHSSALVCSLSRTLSPSPQSALKSRRSLYDILSPALAFDRRQEEAGRVVVVMCADGECERDTTSNCVALYRVASYWY